MTNAGGSCRNSDMHPTQRLSLFRYGSRRNELEDFMRASGMDSTHDIRTSRGGRLACSTVAPCDNGMIVVYRLDELSHSHPLIQVQTDPLSRPFRVFLIARLEPFAKVHASEAGRYDHHRCACTTWLPDRCCTAMLISVRDWQKNTHLRDRRICNVKDEMRNMEYETLQAQTPTYTIEPATTIFCTDMYNTDLPGVNLKDLSESFCLITTKFFFTSFRLQMRVVLWKRWRHMLNVTHRHAFLS